MKELGAKQTTLINRIVLSLKPLELFSEIGYIAEGAGFKVVIRPSFIFRDMIKDKEDYATYVFEADLLAEEDIADEKVLDNYANDVIKSVIQTYVFGNREVVHGPKPS